MGRCARRDPGIPQAILFPAPSERHQNKGGRSRTSDPRFSITNPPVANMSDEEFKGYGEKGPHHGTFGDHVRGHQLGTDPEVHDVVVGDQNELHRELKGRHMQMIAM